MGTPNLLFVKSHSNQTLIYSINLSTVCRTVYFLGVNTVYNKNWRKKNKFLPWFFCGKVLKSFLLQAKSLIEKRKRTIKLERNNKRRSSLSSVTESSRNNQQNNLQSFTKEDESVNLNYEWSRLLNVPY